MLTLIFTLMTPPTWMLQSVCTTLFIRSDSIYQWPDSSLWRHARHRRDVLAVPGDVSDHAVITCCLPLLTRGTGSASTRFVRSWRNVDRQALRQAITESPLGCPLPSATATNLFNTNESVLRNIADRLATDHVIRNHIRPLSPWFDSECRAICRDCQRL